MGADRHISGGLGVNRRNNGFFQPGQLRFPAVGHAGGLSGPVRDPGDIGMLQSLVPIGHLNGLIDGIYIENLLAWLQRAERQGLGVRNGAILEEFLHIVDQGLVKLGVTLDRGVRHLGTGLEIRLRSPTIHLKFRLQIVQIPGNAGLNGLCVTGKAPNHDICLVQNDQLRQLIQSGVGLGLHPIPFMSLLAGWIAFLLPFLQQTQGFHPPFTGKQHKGAILPLTDHDVVQQAIALDGVRQLLDALIIIVAGPEVMGVKFNVSQENSGQFRAFVLEGHGDLRFCQVVFGR